MEGASTHATWTSSPPNQAAQLPDITDTSNPPPGFRSILTVSSSASPSKGIITLHDDPGAVADICFVHGFMGDRVRTWTAPGELEPWPKKLLPQQLGKVRILTYGYDGDDGAANNLLMDLTMERIAGNTSSRPLILVTHTLGAHICKEAVLLSHDNANSHLQVLPNVVDERFSNLIEDHRDRNKPIVTQSFVQEALASKIGRIGLKESATLPGNEPIIINASHREVMRFKSVHDAGFQKIVNVLQLWISEIEDVRNKQPQTDGFTSLQTGRSLDRGRLSRRAPLFPPSAIAPVQRPPSPLEIVDVPTERPSWFRPCYIICSIMALVVIGSGVLGMYYTIRFDRMGDGFTAASWIVAIGAMALAGPMARHYPHCSCWRPTTPYYHAMHRISTLPVS
ncbi:SesB, P-loop containing protein [Fusarium bulbicola]|nr:SesB, P-loop containing protein [Fusarium bulbicola]